MRNTAVVAGERGWVGDGERRALLWNKHRARRASASVLDLLDNLGRNNLAGSAPGSEEVNNADIIVLQCFVEVGFARGDRYVSARCTQKYDAQIHAAEK